RPAGRPSAPGSAWRPAPGPPGSSGKNSGIGRENHKMMLDHYQQTKNLLVSYSAQKLGFF
ncbi:aldehyde dehydrogenase, partial [Streptomyces decoyicus]